MKNKIITLSIVVAFFTATLSFATPPAKPKEGKWRGEFTLSENKVPFNFEITDGGANLVLVNGTRRDIFVITPLSADSIFVKMNTYDAALVAKIESDGRLSGVYKSLVPNFRGNSLPFVAEFGKTYRFIEPGKEIKPSANLSGKWTLNIISKDKTADRVAILKQKGNKLTGVIMSVVGDSRELEGAVQGDEFYLSGFTGPSPFFVKGKITPDRKLQGEIGLGIYINQKFEAVASKKSELPDPYALTYLKEGYTKFDFSLPDLNGNTVTLRDAKYKGKVVIIDIIGTWCPNCTDQTTFLAPWFRENKHRGVEAIAVGFEQKDDIEYARYTLGKLKQKYGIEYDILFGGIADKKVASEKFAALNKMMAFPTTIIIDRQGNVRQIHTGYTGTITGKYFKKYQQKWNKTLDALIAEPVPAKAAVSTVAAGN
ncbi:MAG: peroxiredoxin family protein [Cyclobacteriaceae bacterium]